MKKLVLLLLAIFLIGCSAEENNVENTCTSCIEVIEFTTDHVVWTPTGEKRPSNYPCSENGYRGYISSQVLPTGETLVVYFRVECK